MQVIGIHIKPFEISYVLLQPTLNQPVLLEQGHHPLSLDWNEDQRKIEITSYLNSLLKKYPPPQTSYIFSISQSHISVHKIQFPFKERFKIARALPFEIEEKTPFSSMENLSYGSKITHIAQNNSHVLSFISSKKYLKDQIQFLESIVKIKPSRLIPVGVALANLFEDWQISPPQWNATSPFEQELNLYLSYDSSTALITSQNRVIQVYDINWSLKECIEEIAVKYKRTPQQAFEYFLKNAFITQEKNTHLVPLLKTIDRSLSTLKNKLQLLLVHLKSDGHESIQKIQILGLASAIQNLPTHLFQIFKIPVQLYKVYDPLPSLQPNHFIALGLALEGCKRSKNPPVDLMKNLKPSAEVMLQISKRKKKILKSIAVSVIALMTYVSFRQWQASQLVDQVNPIFSSYARSIVGLKTRNLSVENVEKFLENKQEVAQKNKSYQSLATTSSAMDLLKRVSLSLKNFDQWELELTQLSIDGLSVDMQGFIHKNYLQSLTSQLRALSLNGKIKNNPIQKPLEKLPQKEDPPPSDKEDSTVAENKEIIPFHITFSAKT